jgi:hypothetical protein
MFDNCDASNGKNIYVKAENNDQLQNFVQGIAESLIPNLGGDDSLYVYSYGTITESFSEIIYNQKTVVYVKSTGISGNSCGEDISSPCISLMYVLRYIIKLKEKGTV